MLTWYFTYALNKVQLPTSPYISMYALNKDSLLSFFFVSVPKLHIDQPSPPNCQWPTPSLRSGDNSLTFSELQFGLLFNRLQGRISALAAFLSTTIELDWPIDSVPWPVDRAPWMTGLTERLTRRHRQLTRWHLTECHIVQMTERGRGLTTSGW